MKKILTILFIFLLFIPIVFYSSEVEAKTIADLRKELSAIEKKEAENTNNIIMTESKINATKKEISTIYDNITNITSEIQQSEKDIVDLGIKIEEKDKSTKALMSSLQKTTGNSFYVEYLFGADTIEDFIYRYAITEEITKYNSELIIEMNDNIKELNIKKEELAAQQIELGKKQNLLSTQLQQLANTKTRLYELDRSIEDEIKNSRSVIQMYKDAGCGETEDINVCARRLLPPDTKFWRPFDTGYVTSNYGYRDALYSGGRLISYSGFHEGIDLSNSLGLNNKIYSVANGKVVKIFYDQWGGNQLVIHHSIGGNYYTSSYAHLSKILVREGDLVSKDTVIGMMGSTGSSTGYHLHLAISTGLRYKDYVYYSQYVARCINPRNVINFPSYGSWRDRVSFYN